MNKLEFDGALGAVNAFAISDDGKRAYLFDPRVDAIIRIFLANGRRDTLRWFDRGFHHPRWLCYCMFTMHRDNATYLPTLFYNKKRKAFLLVTFMVDDQKLVLYKTQENIIDVEPVRLDRLAYSAHKDESRLHMIFYDRFERHARPDLGDEYSVGLPFVYSCFNCHTLRVTTIKKTLPHGQWELPFIAHQSLHFISMEFATTQLASLPTDGDTQHSNWNVRPVAADLNDVLPARKATWINAWRAGMGWYIVCEKQIEDFEASRCLTLWQLDVLDCKWRKLPATITTPVTAKNFALRVDLKNTAFLHCDWDREAAIFQMRLDDLMLEREDEAVAASQQIYQNEDFLETDEKDESNCAEISNSEIICPICLETYDDPRTLSCGHSICNSCIEQMKTAVQSNTIRCFACRKCTTIPSSGLPVNFGLKDAIEALERVRQLTFSNLRCAHCRKQCEDADLWICDDCALADAELLAEEIEESVTDGNKRVLFCAQCILKHHTNHRTDELHQFKEKYKSARETNAVCKKEADVLFNKFKTALTEKLESGLLQPLKKGLEQDLRQIFNTMVYDQNETTMNSDETVNIFEKRLIRIINNIDVQFEILLESTHSDERRLSRCERPTEL